MMQHLEGNLSVSVEVTDYVFLFTRVLGSVTNFKEFGKAYSCRSGSKMNPTSRCEFWWYLWHKNFQSNPTKMDLKTFDVSCYALQFIALHNFWVMCILFSDIDVDFDLCFYEYYVRTCFEHYICSRTNRYGKHQVSDLRMQRGARSRMMQRWVCRTLL